MQGLPAIGFPEPPKPPEGPVPSVIGMSRKEAITTLSKAGFRASVEIADSLSPRGQVFSQSPSGGSVVALGTSVSVQISTGEPPQITMPRVVGMRGFGAQVLLESLGLKVTVVRVETGNKNKIGFVVDQDPPSQTLLIAGDTVTISVGEAKGGGGGNGGGGGGGG
jgi:eukaryotic-like serine/threonine-protein kinase